MASSLQLVLIGVAVMASFCQVLAQREAITCVVWPDPNAVPLPEDTGLTLRAGQSLTRECREGFMFSGGLLSRSFDCMATGNWSGEEMCLPDKPPTPPPRSGGGGGGGDDEGGSSGADSMGDGSSAQLLPILAGVASSSILVSVLGGDGGASTMGGNNMADPPPAGGAAPAPVTEQPPAAP